MQTIDIKHPPSARALAAMHAALAKLADVTEDDVQVDTIRETAIDVNLGDIEAGFVLQEYPDGIVRRAYFFADGEEVDLCGRDLDAVASVLYPSTPSS